MKKGGNWSENELQVLKETFTSKGADEIARITGRTAKAVKIKANRLGLFQSVFFEEYYEQIPIHIRAYLSGHFDGEGCVRFRQKHSTFSPTVIASICHKPTLLLYQSYYGGSVTKSLNKNGNKEIYTWRLVGFTDLYNLFKSIVPFSIEKKEQLQICLEHLNEWSKIGNRSNPGDAFRLKAKERHAECTLLKKV
jgi:hypothetical protein